MDTEVQSATNDVRFRETWPHFAVCLVLAGLFAGSGVAAWDLGLGSFASPDVGLWPMLASMGGLGLSVALAVRVLLGSHDREAELFGDVKWIPLAVFVFSIIGFLALYPVIGFLPAAVPMTFVLLKYAAGASWIPSVVISLVAPLALYLLFRELLNVRF